MEERTRGYRRDVNYRKALHKKKLSDQWMLTSYWGMPYYNNLHAYSKNKIFCSCGMCSRWTKTNNSTHRRRRIHGNYAPSYNPPMRDKKRLEAMAASLEEYYNEI